MDKHENADTSGRYAAIADALHKYLETFSTNKEETFEKVMTNGIRPFADAVGLDRVVFYKMVNTEGGKRLGQIYQWDKTEGGLIPVIEELKVLPNHPVLDKWVSITSQGGCIRLKESDYSKDEAAFLRTYGVKSILVMPIFTHGKLWGNICFQDHTNGVYFDEGCTDLLYAAARISSNAIIRDEMRRRLNMEATLNKAAVMFLSQNQETFEAAMTAGIREIANAFNLDRFSIWRNSNKEDGLHGGQIYRWDRESGGTTVATKGLEDLVYAKFAPRWEKLFASGEIINSPARFLPEAPLLKSFGCATVFIAPLLINSVFWGFALIEDRSSERFFEDDDIDMLRSAAFLCANTVIRADMEREIVDTNEFNVAILDASPLGFTIFDEKARVIGCNDTLAKLLKTTKKYYVEHFDEFSPEYQNDGSKSIDKAIELVKRVLNGEKLIFEWILCTSAKEPIHNEVTLVRAMYKGKYVALGYQYNLQERKKREMELANARDLVELQLAKLNTVVHATKIGLWEMEVVKNDPLNPSNPIICSDEFRHMLGYKDENDFPNRLSSWTNLLHPQDMKATLDIFKKHILDKTGKTPYDVEYRMQRKTGEYGYYHATGESIRDKDGNAIRIVGALTDITETKNMLMDKDIQMEAVEAANRAKSTFLANMSHELRTPLNVIIGLTNLLLEEDMDKHIAENLIKINNAGSTLLSIVNDVLDLSKIESGNISISPVEYSTPSLVNDVITLTISRLGEKPIKFHLDIEDDLPNKLYGDDLRVKQVLTNLLTNAVKYTREGSIILKLRCTREGDVVWMDIAVTDTGMGIPKDSIKNLFVEYYQVEDTANRKIEGTGLGLPITKTLVEMMDGKINVESEQGKGSTFSFRIKQGFVDDTVLGKDVSDKLRNFCYIDDRRATNQKLVRINLNYARVLVVDDMQTNLDVASGLLSKYRMHVDCLNNGQAAIEKIKAGTPVYNAIFMDHMMPGMDGIETVDRIRALGTDYAKKIPIIALTANAIHGTDKMFYEHDFQAFVTKPIDVMELDAALRKWVRDGTREEVPISLESSGNDENTAIEIPGVDTKRGLALYADDKGIYVPLLRSYIANTPGVLEKMRTVSKENLSDYVITVHGLKGTSAGIGAEDIRVQALELENESRAGDLKGVLAKNDKLIADTEVIVANVKAWLDKNDVHDAKPRKKSPDKELLAKLRESCENYDIDGVDKAMTELESADYEENADLIVWIREKINISKMGEVAKRLNML